MGARSRPVESTFSTRFNRLRSERGHLFQGRYQALLVDDDGALAAVVDYIHLNPVRARVVPPERCATFRWSNLRCFCPGPCPAWLSAERWLAARALENSAAGWSRYADHLAALARKTDEEAPSFSSGLAIGTAGCDRRWQRLIDISRSPRTSTPRKFGPSGSGAGRQQRTSC